MGNCRIWLSVLTLVLLSGGCVGLTDEKESSPMVTVQENPGVSRFLSGRNFIRRWSAEVASSAEKRTILCETEYLDLADFTSLQKGDVVCFVCSVVFDGSKAEDVVLYLGSSNLVKAYWNDHLAVVYDRGERVAERDQDRSGVLKLKPGCNTLRIEAVYGGDEWKLFVRLAGMNERPLIFE